MTDVVREVTAACCYEPGLFPHSTNCLICPLDGNRWACSGRWRRPGSSPLARRQIEETRVSVPHPPYQETNCFCRRCRSRTEKQFPQAPSPGPGQFREPELGRSVLSEQGPRSSLRRLPSPGPGRFREPELGRPTLGVRSDKISRSSCDGNPSSRFRSTPLLLEIPNKISFSRPDLSYSHTVKQHTGAIHSPRRHLPLL
ncbi:Hypothetical predicted protein [Marmota monax]|uniref:Uncharacterized protein n=1 Tax=Marmota monax TaxID=9995 RepID=A0A5E4C006_MARMO|nr:Hypothetical predicted protein [Marmota monax]